MRSILICLYSSLLAGLWLTTARVQGDELPPLHIDANRITVSGISSGAQMAHQLHLAYPELFSGVGLLAGGPFGCAEGSLVYALGRCLAKPGTEIPLGQLQAIIADAAADGRLGNLALLADDPVWIFHGSKDQAVPEAVNSALVQLYQELLPGGNIRTVTDVPAAHVFPTRGQGGPCDQLEPPFVGDCNYDAAGELLQFLYSGLQLRGVAGETALQRASLPGAADALLDETAWLFIPPACQEAGAGCALHLVLHGCGQSASQVEQGFMQQSGYLPWAESNHIVLAFPQAKASMANPLACWDWWGYADPAYLWRDGKQLSVLANWTRQLAGIKTD